MTDVSKLDKKESESFLFIPVTAFQEVVWLAKHSGLLDYRIYNRQAVRGGHVNAVKHLGDEEKKEEIRKFYGEENVDGMMAASCVIVSKYDKKELFEAFKETLIGKGDADWKEHERKERAFANATIPDSEGIPVIED